MNSISQSVSINRPPPPPGESRDRAAQVLTCTSVDEARVGDGATTNLSWSPFSGSISTITSLHPFCVLYRKQTNPNSDRPPCATHLRFLCVTALQVSTPPQNTTEKCGKRHESSSRDFSSVRRGLLYKQMSLKTAQARKTSTATCSSEALKITELCFMCDKQAVKILL